MTTYLTYGRFFIIYIELNLKFSIYPIFSIEKWKKETLIHFPYTKIIYTPHNCLNGTQKNENTKHKKLNLPSTQTPIHPP